MACTVHGPGMVDAAVAAVVVAGVSVVTSGGVALTVAVLTSKRATNLARENRLQQRLADSYVDVLRIVEREGLWLRAQLHNWEAATREDEYDPIPRMLVPSPALPDQATVAALLAAFGSDVVRAKYDDWRSTVDQQVNAHEVVSWNVGESGDPDAVPSDADLLLLQEAHMAQVTARQALADTIAAELGHRPSP